MDLDERWEAVEAHAERLKPLHLRQLMEAGRERVDRLAFRLDDLTMDFSREKIDGDSLDSLIALADAAGVGEARRRMASGERINLSEGRSVLHMALRGSVRPPEGDDVKTALERFLAFAEKVRSGRFASAGGPVLDVVNIGIGGSDLGPRMAARALKPGCDGPRLHFVSNVDSADFRDTVEGIDPARAMVVVSSKTFATSETLANARLARDWLGRHAGSQMAAASARPERCAEFGIPAERVFGYWEWVGGRYSVWSAVGLPLAIGIGAAGFRSFLDGAASMDRHFLEAPLERNLPVLHALVGIWRRNAMGWPTAALIPYDQRLEQLPAYVQQLEMESNGKRAANNGELVDCHTAPVVWGGVGTSAQHSFFQLLHQGTDTAPVDFVLAAEPRDGDPPHHDLLVANCLAQGESLALGRSVEELIAAENPAEGTKEAFRQRARQRETPGDRPSTTILHRRLDPFALGRLIALFEHKVFVQGVVWGVNSFDQWGVELGKSVAASLARSIRDGGPAPSDLSTRALLDRIRELRR